MAYQANNCYPDLCSRTWWELSFQSITGGQHSPSHYWMKTRKLAGQKIIIIYSFSNHSGDYRSGHLLSTQSIINQFSFSTMGLVFCVSLKTKTCCLAGCPRQHLTAWPRTTCCRRLWSSFHKLVYFINKQFIAVNEKNAWARQNESNFSLSHKFWLLGCCSYLLFSP